MFLYDDLLIYRAREKIVYQLPLSIVLLSKACCHSECYTTSILLSTCLDSFLLVHGNINALEKNDDYPNHSWVEKDGLVYDTSDGFCILKEKYYQTLQPEIVNVYDEKTVEDYSFYQEVVGLIQDGTTIDNKDFLALRLQYLLSLDEEKNSCNYDRLQRESDICRDQYQATKVYSKKVVEKFKQYMDEERVK